MNDTAPIMTIAEEKIAFHNAIGDAIASWSHIEYGLCFVTHRALQAVDFEQLRRSIISIENFRSKLAFTNRAVIGSISMTAYIAEWNAIQGYITALAGKRNMLAHCRAVHFLDGQEGRRLAIIPQIIPKPSKMSKKNLAPPGSLAVKDIDLIQRQFSRAHSMLMSLYLRSGGEEDHYEGSFLQEPQCRTLVQIAHQIRAVRPMPE